MIESFIEFLLSAGSDFFEAIFSWILYILTFIIDLFLSFLFSSSSTIRFTGRSVVTAFDSFSSFNFSGDFIYFFVGLLVIIFIFKLIWSLIP